ncbi:hypothetical protein DFH06DRAFT_1242353 [Mycena polygramma]|nr:hypothetical protein DFH06DRAFT_1242353 [Mycena polygramma]
MTALTIEIHPLQRCPALPPNVSKVYRECDRPIPRWCSTGPYPHFSPGLLSLLPEIPDLSTSLCDSYHASEERLSDVFETCLSTVADIRSLIQLYGPSRSALPFVFSLIRVLIHVCSKEATINTDARFVRPRRLPVAEDALDGTATMLVCHLVVNTQHEDPPPPMDAVEAEPESAESSDLMSVDADSEQSSTLASSNSPPSIELPLEAHVLPGCGRHHFVALPLLCCAGSDSITDLMCSVACQRHVWGINEPVVGFLFSPSGVSATLVLSWVDPVTHVVHVVRPVDDPPHSSPGRAMFDFTSPASVLRFAQLILNLSSHFTTISEHTIASCKNNGLDWRSDTMKMSSEKFGTDRVAQWIRDVKTALLTSLPSSASFTPPLIPTPNRAEPSDEEMASKSKASLTSPDSGKPATKPTRSWKSSSAFAGSSNQGLTQIDKADTLTWLFDRHVLLVTRLPPDQDIQDITEYKAMLGVYDEMCGYKWSSALTSESCPVDGGLNDVRDLLFEQAAEMANGAPDLKPEHVEILQKHMSGLLYASMGAYTKTAREENPFGININEAEARYDWDATLYHFYVTADEHISPCVLFERSINYPKNELVDSESLVSQHEDLLRENLLICSAAETAALRGGNKPLRAQTGAASAQARKFTDACEKLIENPLKLKAGVEKRSRMEPRTGICDALLFGAVKASDAIAQEARFVITATAKSAASPDKKLDYLGSPFAVCTTETSIIQQGIEPPPKPFKGKNFLLPHAVAEYKKPSDDDGKALNQGRMYLVSLVSFFSALGIENYPFFGFVTSGKKGAILMAWKSSVKDRIYLIERNVREFDISIPIQAFHFATFLLRLRDDQEKLKKLVLTKLQDVELKRVRDWTKLAQVGPVTEAERKQSEAE